jgi:hypothetical protein
MWTELCAVAWNAFACIDIAGCVVCALAIVAWFRFILTCGGGRFWK